MFARLPERGQFGHLYFFINVLIGSTIASRQNKFKDIKCIFLKSNDVKFMMIC